MVLLRTVPTVMVMPFVVQLFFIIISIEKCKLKNLDLQFPLSHDLLRFKEMRKLSQARSSFIRIGKLQAATSFVVKFFLSTFHDFYSLSVLFHNL